MSQESLIELQKMITEFRVIDGLAISSFERDAMIFGLLTGFAFTALVKLLSSQGDLRRRVSWITVPLIVATNFLLIEACSAWVLADYAVWFQRKSISHFPEAMMPAILIYVLAGYLGTGALTLSFALLGFLRSWWLGLFSMLVAGAAFLVFLLHNTVAYESSKERIFPAAGMHSPE